MLNWLGLAAVITLASLIFAEAWFDPWDRWGPRLYILA
jgi:hypothetical protein